MIVFQQEKEQSKVRDSTKVIVQEKLQDRRQLRGIQTLI